VWLRQAPNDPDGQCIVEYRAVIGNGCDQPIDIAARHQFALDALCNALDLDDRYIVSLTLEKRIDPLHPHPESIWVRRWSGASTGSMWYWTSKGS
jgi:hypothetical protein